MLHVLFYLKIPLGSVAVASPGSISVSRNPDAFGDDGLQTDNSNAYFITKPLTADSKLCASVCLNK